MAYTLNDYFQHIVCSTTRVELYPNSAVAAMLVNKHKSYEALALSVAECMPGAFSLPMPDELMKTIDFRIDNEKTRVVIVGVDAYLSLLSESNVAAFFVALKGRIHNGKLNAAFIVSDQYKQHFDAPRYEEALSVVRILGDSISCEPPTVEVVSESWINPEGNPTDYEGLLKRLGDYIPAGRHTLVLNNLLIMQAGLSNDVSFLLDIHRIAERFYGISADLKTSTLELLIAKSKRNGISPESYIEAEFGKPNINIRLALKRLNELPDDDIWAAYTWMLLKRLPSNSYLAKVLVSDVTHSNLLRKYVIDVIIPITHSVDAERYADERAEALVGIEVESLIVEFVGQAKEIKSAARFLNCKTIAERQEIIRRTFELDLVTGLPELYQRLYPTLADYLSTEFCYDSHDLTEYFKEYRRFKMTNSVTEAFVRRAFDFNLPKSYPTRESLLADLRADSDVALLTVDGMGAEYLPLLRCMARRREMSIEYHNVASVKLPSITDFNKIPWDKNRKLDTVRVVDTTAHDGAEKHENNPPERNIEKALRTFDEVFNRIASGLSQFSRVVVTADHGTSRLAVIARNKGFSTDLPWDGHIDDWRYSLAPASSDRPPEFEHQYHPDSGKTYWIVRGYNRLPKRGGKLNELHGGASLEERLVPVVVFTKAKTAIQPTQPAKKTSEQIVDKMDFDI